MSGISNEIFRQIETVENRYDQSTAEAFRWDERCHLLNKIFNLCLLLYTSLILLSLLSTWVLNWSLISNVRAVQKSGEMVVRKLDPRQFIRLASETAPKINVNTNVSETWNVWELHWNNFNVKYFKNISGSRLEHQFCRDCKETGTNSRYRGACFNFFS